MKPAPRVAKGDHVEVVGCHGDGTAEICVTKPDGQQHGGRLAKANAGRPVLGAAQVVWLDRGGVVKDVCDLDGPAKVATKAYRQGYDRVFGTKELN